jgi:hypothetical protein
MRLSLGAPASCRSSPALPADASMPETMMSMPETMTDVHQRLQTALRGDLDAQWEQVLDQWEEAGVSQKKAIVAYVSGLRNRMLRTLLDLETGEEIEHGLALQYIEVKCHWMMLNMQIQSQTARDGQAKDDLVYRATCVSLIIAALEPLLARNRVDTLTDFLAEPLRE